MDGGTAVVHRIADARREVYSSFVTDAEFAALEGRICSESVDGLGVYSGSDMAERLALTNELFCIIQAAAESL